MKVGTIRALACVGVGAALGFVAAGRDSGPASRGNAGIAARGGGDR